MRCPKCNKKLNDNDYYIGIKNYVNGEKYVLNLEGNWIGKDISSDSFYCRKCDAIIPIDKLNEKIKAKILAKMV